MNLFKYKLPLEALPHQAKKIIKQKVIESEFIDSNNCSTLIEEEAIGDGIYKNREQSYFVKCTTEMLKVTPEMIRWWFVWHLPSSERYKLWHPRDHISARLNEKGICLQFEDKYIGVDSFVEEYIGKKLQKLQISFKEPSLFGLVNQEDSVAICAYVTDIKTGVRVAKFLHYVSKTERGSVMKSFFWMGSDISHPNSFKNFILTNLTKIQPIKGLFLNDDSVLDLLIHCYEEMNHLSKILPNLYKEFAEIQTI
tara:strand:- start:734 stop:1492 length:759 start_codon:yes stop_codon:yes gene_type:complete